jgi:hypothetical protein
VRVLDSKSLRHWLLTQSVVLEPRNLSEIAAVMNNPASWRLTPVVDQSDLEARFGVLATRVRKAQVIRHAWFAGACVAIIAACWIVVSSIFL